MSDWLKRDPDNGSLIGPDGCHYENEHQACHYAVLHLCGCGSPEEAYNFCRDALALFDRRGTNDNPPTKEWVNAETMLVSLVKERPAEAAHVLAHFLSHLKLTEHGGTVGGSWLTENGTRIIDLGPTTEELLEQGRV